MHSDDVSDRLRGVFAAHPAVQAAFLFGSVAAGTDRADSDVDIGLVVEPERWEPMDKVDLLGDSVRAGVERIDLVVLNDAPLVV